MVSWRDLGIEGSFTIEASFCGSGNNDEKRILKKYEDVRPFVNSQSSGLKNKQSIAVSSNTSTPSTTTGNAASIESVNGSIRTGGLPPTSSIDSAGFNTGGGLDLQQEYDEVPTYTHTHIHTIYTYIHTYVYILID